MCREIWTVYWALLQLDVLIRSFKVCLFRCRRCISFTRPTSAIAMCCISAKLVGLQTGIFFEILMRWTTRPCTRCWKDGSPLCSSVTAWLQTASVSGNDSCLKVKKITFKWKKKKIHLRRALDWIGKSCFRKRLVEFSIIQGVDAKVVVLGPISAGWCHITRGFFFFCASMGFPSKAPRASITLLAPLNGS